MLSDVSAIPSLWEGSLIALLKAIYLRVPVATTLAGLMAELTKPGETGILVPREVPVSLAQKPLTILDNPKLAQAMGKEGWQLC